MARVGTRQGGACAPFFLVADERAACVPTWVVAARTALKWMFANGVAKALLPQVPLVGSTRRLDPQRCCVKFPGVPVLRDLVATVVYR